MKGEQLVLLEPEPSEAAPLALSALKRAAGHRKLAEIWRLRGFEALAREAEELARVWETSADELAMFSEFSLLAGERS